VRGQAMALVGKEAEAWGDEAESSQGRRGTGAGKQAAGGRAWESRGAGKRRGAAVAAMHEGP
jgi:hypothetical protein